MTSFAHLFYARYLQFYLIGTIYTPNILKGTSWPL
jgi:hypothetical protein